MVSSLQSWGEILRTQNLSSERRLDTVSRWLLVTRASAFPLTVTSGAIGGLLAASAPDPNWLYFAVALLGLVLAHAASNMLNDFFDLESGLDGGEYLRRQHAPHPVLSGLISKTGFLLAIAIVNLLALGILLYLTEARGWGVAAFALLGLFVGVSYVAPPLKLRHRGLGGPSVALVWGPLMVGGTYYATRGALEPWVLVASLPWAILVATVLIGQHIDKYDTDAAKGIHTLPVLLGKERSLFLNQQLMVTYFVFVLSLVMVGSLGAWTLLTFLALPRTWEVIKVYNKPRPQEPPVDYPIWPLWYVAWAFLLTRRAGGLFVLGLIVDTIYPIHL